MPALALTMGEPAGIGGDIALAAWVDRRAGLPAFFMLDDPARLAALAATLGLDVPVVAISDPHAAADVFVHALPVLPVALPRPVAPGRPDAANSGAVVASITQAVALVRAGQAAAVVTNPIHKDVLYRAGFGFPGHTEFLADLAGGVQPVMMLACDQLKVVPVTVHIPLAQVAATLTADLIVETGRITAHGLARDFAVAAPRLAVCGLNPHAGEGGAMGGEDALVVAPAVARLRAMGIDARGPLPADTVFHPRARATYDVVLCMYHDQALIPIKTIDFDHGVNVTLGLPFVRTSPDHGTAFDLAGSGRARPDSLIAALRMAAFMAHAHARAGAA